MRTESRTPKRKLSSSKLSVESLEDRRLLAISAAGHDAALDVILDGVSEWTGAVNSQLGTIAVFDPAGTPSGQGAFGVAHNGKYDVEIGGAIWGSGRILAYAHPRLVDFSTFADDVDTGKLYANSVEWATSSASEIASKGKAIVTNSIPAETWLKNQGYTKVTKLPSSWGAAELNGAELAILPLDTVANGAELSQVQASALGQFVQGGGGLITGAAGWALGDLKATPANAFLRDAGLSWGDGKTRDSTPSETSISRSSLFANVSNLLPVFDDFAAGRVAANATFEAAAAFLQVTEVLPATHSFYQDLSVAVSSSAAVSPTPGNPMPTSSPVATEFINWEADTLLVTPVNQVVAHRTAEQVYGEIPVGADTSERTVSINTNTSRWLSTGMYAVPGEVVTINVPNELVGKAKIRISGHVQNVTKRQEWKRVPRNISREFPINNDSLQVANAFGGAIYVDVGTKAPKLGKLDIRISGAVQAPYFKLGETSNDAWDSIRNLPGAYAELASEHMVFSLPSAWIRNLEDAEALMTFWDKAVSQLDWVAGIENDRQGPERINVDVQMIPDALLLGGNPIQGPTDFQGSLNLVDLPLLQQEGDWGYFHEIGHSMQLGPDRKWTINPYTFNGKQFEVSVNIFSNAAMEAMALNEGPITLSNNEAWAYAQDPVQVMQRSIEAVNDDRPFLKKITPDGTPKTYAYYFQLADGFGWETYREVLKSYVDDTNANRPIPTKQQKIIDEWLIRWSRASGHNLVKFMVETWKQEASQGAIDTVNAMRDASGNPLTSWMPLAATLKPQHTTPGESILVELEGAALPLDGTATFIGIAVPNAGKTEFAADNKMIRYTPDPGFLGIDEFSLVFESSAGNRIFLRQAVNVGLPLAWRMDEGFGGVVANDALNTGDIVGTGTIHGAPKWVSGHNGTALQLDGVHDAITINDSASLSGNTDFTVSAWIRTNESGMIAQQRGEVEGGNPSSNLSGQFNFLVQPDGKLNFWILNGGEQFNLTSDSTVNDGQWHHVVAQRAGRDGRIFVDGETVATGGGDVRSLNADFRLAIGFDVRDSDEYFAGTIDEVRIYDSAVNVDAISKTTFARRGLVSSWEMNDRAGSTVLDQGTANATGTINGDPKREVVFTGEALVLDGQDDRIDFGTSPALGGTTDFTVSAWIRTTGDGMILQQRGEVENENTSTNLDGQYNLLVKPDGKLNFWIYNAGFEFDLTSSAVVNDGAWHHVVAFRSANLGGMYVDGVQVAQGTSTDIRALNADFGVAIGYDLRDNDEYFDGAIDDVRIYTEALLPTDIDRERLTGDADENGKVEFNDFLILSWNFGRVDAAWSDGDFDANGKVDFADFLVLSRTFGNKAR